MILAASFLLASLLACPPTAAPEYDRYKLFELVADADFVVTGTIRTVGLDPTSSWMDRVLGRDVPRVFTLAVDRSIVGDSLPNPLLVHCFEDWTCAGRWTSYEKGQQVLLFLARPPEKSSVYSILGGGGEGEMPLQGDSICVRGYSVRGYEPKVHVVGKSTAEGSLVSLTEFASAIQTFRETYSWGAGPRGYQVGWIQPKKDLASAEAYSRTSRTARHLHEEAISSGAWRSETSQTPPRILPSATRRLTARANQFSGPTRLAPGRKPDPYGFELNTDFGHAVTFLGDVDGDGVEDLAVGAPRDSFLGLSHGAAWIVFLASDGSMRRSTEIRERVNGFPDEMNEFSSLGRSLAPLGDIDGNGLPDFAIGAPNWDGDGEDRGGVWILSLAKDGTIARAKEIGGDPRLKEAGVKDGSGLGCSIANVGDLDGDGFPELVIGEDPEFDMGLAEGRAVYVVSVDASASVRWVRRLHDRSDGFASDYSWLGEAVAGLGDIDGDGVRDVAISDPHAEDGGELRGAVWIVFLKADGSLKGKQKISDWQGSFEGTLHDWSMFGEALCGPGDVDGDGIPDLLVGSSDGFWTLFLRGDGIVRSHVLTASGGMHDVNRDEIGISISSRARRPSVEGIPIAVGGWLGGEQKRNDSAVWLMRLAADGTLASW
jgi:hypothetical protein